jgi:hypothetical protein
MNNALKQRLYNEARETFRAWHGDDLAQKGACLYWARIVIMVLAFHEMNACLQAGTMLWQMVPNEEDDGVCNTHFGFQWEPGSPASIAQINKGLLPEVHIWCGIVDTQELVDFSTGTFAQIARARGHNWRMPDPPPFLWCQAKDLPDAAHYAPNMEATLLAQDFLFKAHKEQLEQLIEV